MITPILSDKGGITGVVSLSSAPQTAVFSRREIENALRYLDGLAPDDARVDLAIISEGAAPVIVLRPLDAKGDAWIAVAGHTETKAGAAKCSEAGAVAPNITPNISEPPKSCPPNVPAKPDSSLEPTLPEERQEPKPPAPKAETTPEADVCADCGAAVSKTQVQMSNLFLNRTLCKTCMDKATGKEASKC